MTRRLANAAGVVVTATSLLAGCASRADPPPSTAAASIDAPIKHGDPDARRYLEDVRAAIRRGWKYPCVAGGGPAPCDYPHGTVVLEFRIAWDGTLVFTEIVTASSHPALDTAAKEAVTAAAPFPPVPAVLKRAGNGIPIRVTMTYRGDRKQGPPR